MIAPGIADRGNDSGSKFSTAEIKTRIEALFAARAPRARTDRHDSHDRDEKEP
ncbi:hypothetical protein AB0M34_27885 [Nocardia sp. NPDC050193]